VKSVNDDRSPLLDLIVCVECNQAMRLESIDPEGEGDNMIQYRCSVCSSIERLRILRRSR
jgi:hypothetical protein